MSIWTDWRFFALGSAFFAALTAILGKVGVSGVNSDLATFIRTVVILGVTALLVSLRAEWSGLGRVSSQTLLFLVLSGIATGFSWLFYYRALQLGPASRVAPIDKLSVVIVMILAGFFLKEVPDKKAVLGGVMMAAGAVLIALP